MNLLDLQADFNQAYSFDEIKKNSIKTLEELIANSENNYLHEEEEKLPSGLKFKDYIISYTYTEIMINNEYRLYPFFRISLDLVHPKTKKSEFYYDIEYTIDGEFSDEFFSNY
ncbi:hypothetical protein [Paenibacillus cucumis (ex Kampfer et al. 2016)]|uniref:Uncharacterized protein n=1 Tax=Paenibacillus cucumis (ex Kampfer et al. 2016) TaxID=1776858 RepID=A0ABS7KKG4_9BACL|nr:hypothetical protein [Paenibacillus cucumis (ex Kampfer et al. 2016)]MBY0204431.1 hypothetical protein [Paenibacillus cucumis (ex Kampfer et al. 2016)]